MLVFYSPQIFIRIAIVCGSQVPLKHMLEWQKKLSNYCAWRKVQESEPASKMSTSFQTSDSLEKPPKDGERKAKVPTFSKSELSLLRDKKFLFGSLV